MKFLDKTGLEYLWGKIRTPGTASYAGVVRLSDAYTTSGGAAANSVGASSKAVNDLYNDAVSTAEAKKAYHLKFYIDGDGDLCQAD